VKAALARHVADVVRHAPRGATEPLAFVLGSLLSATYEREAALANLARVYPHWSEARRRDVARRAYRHAARILIEFLHTSKYTDEEIRERVRLENADLLAEAHAEGKGVLLLSGHFGNWEWLGRRVRVEGYRFAALYKEPKDEALAARLRATRAESGIVQIDYDDMRSAVRWLREGGVLGIIMDQEPREGEGAIAPLLGQPTMTYTGPFRMAHRIGVPTMTVFNRRTAPQRYRARLERFRLSARDDVDRAVADDAAAFNARLEAAIRRDPDHWLWMYRRWRRLGRRLAAATPVS